MTHPRRQVQVPTSDMDMEDGKTEKWARPAARIRTHMLMQMHPHKSHTVRWLLALQISQHAQKYPRSPTGGALMAAEPMKVTAGIKMATHATTSSFSTTPTGGLRSSSFGPL